MECPYIPEIQYSEFGTQLLKKVAGQRVPLSVSMDMTARCNLRCRHCYIVGDSKASSREELHTSDFYQIFDQLAEAGTLWLLLTGGEPLLRPDFWEVYSYAKHKGFLITLFTNGTLLTPQIADQLADLPPFKVEISLYGQTQTTYERITGVPGSYTRCMRSIELLLERDIRVGLKTVLITLNQHELWDIKAYAESLGVPFRFDPMINGALDGSRRPLGLRLSPEEIVQFDVDDPDRRSEWKLFFERFSGISPDPTYRYVCSAGLRSCHIDAYGQLSLCLIAQEPKYDLQAGTFQEGWEVLEQVRNQPPQKKYKCSQCELFSLCGQCPGWSQLENGDPDTPVDFLCRVAHLRAKALNLSSE